MLKSPPHTPVPTAYVFQHTRIPMLDKLLQHTHPQQTALAMSHTSPARALSLLQGSHLSHPPHSSIHMPTCPPGYPAPLTCHAPASALRTWIWLPMPPSVFCSHKQPAAGRPEGNMSTQMRWAPTWMEALKAGSAAERLCCMTPLILPLLGSHLTTTWATVRPCPCKNYLKSRTDVKNQSPDTLEGRQ